MGMENYMLRESSVKRLQEVGLANGVEVTKTFENVYDYYGRYLLQYLDKKLHLSEREQEIASSALKMRPVKEEDQDAYQSLSPLKFFFIRNNLKIERLPIDYIDLIKRRIFQKKTELDEKTEKMIELTYLDVVRNKNYQEGTQINYGPTTSTDFFAPNNAVVLGFRFDPEYETDTGEDHEWLKTYMQRKSLVASLCRYVREEAEKQGLPVYVIEYDEATVTTKKEREEVIPLYRG